MGKESTAFVIGNGTSRLGFNLEKLKKYGKTYGCNAIYRDFIPDQLLAVDSKMIKEFSLNKVYEKTEIWVNDNNAANVEHKEGLNFLTGELKKGTGCGFTALLKALQDGSSTIYMIGFDLHPIDERPYQYFNNVYANTEGYKGDRDTPPSNDRYIPKLCRILNDYPEVKFIRAYDIETAYIPDEWISPKNIIHISNTELAEELDVKI